MDAAFAAIDDAAGLVSRSTLILGADMTAGIDLHRGDAAARK